jgi:hypothetical protein
VNEELDRQAGSGRRSAAPAAEEGEEPEEAEIEELVRRWAEAAGEREMAFLEALLAPEFTITSGDEARTREQYLAAVRDASGGEPRAVEDVAVQHYGRFAVARWRGAGGRVTDALVKQAGRWRAVARHIS